MRYPAILDRTDLPAVFRSVRCPRPNYALTGKHKAPERDLLKRIAQLAGVRVADQIADEFGGKPVYVRPAVDARGRVYCRDCQHLHVDPSSHSLPRCGLTRIHVSPVHMRTCRKFAA